MPGKLWPTLFGEKKEIRYIWRSAWFEPKPSITFSGVLLIIILLLVAAAGIFAFTNEKEKIPVRLPKQEQAAKEVNFEPQGQINTVQKQGLQTQPRQSDISVLVVPSEPENILEQKSDNLSLVVEQATEQEKNEKVQKLLNSSQITEFGWQYSELYKDWRFHQGIIFSAEVAGEIPAVTGGQVEDVITDGNFGLTVIVRNDNFETYYGSLSGTSLKKKDQVSAGDSVGVVEGVDGKKEPQFYLAVKSLASGKYINPKILLEE